MFSGIVQAQSPLTVESRLENLSRLSIPLTDRQADGLLVGASIALNGVCLTVTKIEQGRAYFDVMMETLRITNLGEQVDGDLVNTERASRFGDDIGGHVMSGHVSTTVVIDEIERPENNCIIWFSVTAEQKKYLFNKGFVGLNGCSLTIGEVTDSRFNVYLIPETLAVTNFGDAQVGRRINMEYDAHTQAIVDTLERMRETGQL